MQNIETLITRTRQNDVLTIGLVVSVVVVAFLWVGGIFWIRTLPPSITEAPTITAAPDGTYLVASFPSTMSATALTDTNRRTGN